MMVPFFLHFTCNPTSFDIFQAYLQYSQHIRHFFLACSHFLSFGSVFRFDFNFCNLYQYVKQRRRMKKNQIKNVYMRVVACVKRKTRKNSVLRRHKQKFYFSSQYNTKKNENENGKQWRKKQSEIGIEIERESENMTKNLRNNIVYSHENRMFSINPTEASEKVERQNMRQQMPLWCCHLLEHRAYCESVYVRRQSERKSLCH